MHIAIGRGSGPLRYQRRHRQQDKFGAQIFGRFDAPLVELTDTARSAPPCCGELRLELSFRTSTPTLDPFSGEAVRWLMPLHLMDISDAPDSWRRRRTLESVSFAEASQLRSFIIFRPYRLRDGAPESYEAEPPSPGRRSRASGFFEAEMGIRVLRGGDGYPSRRSRKHIFQSSRLLLRCKGAALYVMAPVHDWRRSGGWAVRYMKCCSKPFGGGPHGGKPDPFVLPVCNSGLQDSRRRSGGWAVRYMKCCPNPFGGGPHLW